MPAIRTGPESRDDTRDREILITRVLDAPRERVFQAWTDPAQVTLWWGPRGFTTSTKEIDVRPGGVWRFVMHGPDGTDYQNKIVYHVVDRPHRLEYEHTGEEGEPVRFRVTVTFEVEGSRTRLTMRMVFPSAAELKRIDETYGAIEGARQHAARLEDYLASHD